MRFLPECLQKKVYRVVATLQEAGFVEEVESAAREPGGADESGLAPCGISMNSGIIEFIPACVDDVLANVDGKRTVVHVGQPKGREGSEQREGNEGVDCPYMDIDLPSDIHCCMAVWAHSPRG